MNMTEKQNALFSEWKKKEPGLVTDGVIDEQQFLTDRHCNFRIYSQQFVQNLMRLNGMDEQGSYSIEGNYLKTQNAAIFKLRRPVGASQVVQ